MSKKEGKLDIDILPKPVLNISENVLLKNETLLYTRDNIIITNKRLIKHKTGKLCKMYECFCDDYQDMELSKIVSIKINELIHMGLFSVGFATLLIVPLLLTLTQVEAVISSFPYIEIFALKLSSIIFIISMIFFVFSYFNKKRVLSVIGLGGARIDYHKYNHGDLLRIREYQAQVK